MENTAYNNEERMKKYDKTIRVPLDELVDTKENIYELTSKAIKKAAIISSDSALVDVIESKKVDDVSHAVLKDSCKVCSIALAEVLTPEVEVQEIETAESESV